MGLGLASRRVGLGSRLGLGPRLGLGFWLGLGPGVGLDLALELIRFRALPAGINRNQKLGAREQPCPGHHLRGNLSEGVPPYTLAQVSSTAWGKRKWPIS